jgi:protein involved in polysaccharide export with SLBB domain
VRSPVSIRLACAAILALGFASCSGPALDEPFEQPAPRPAAPPSPLAAGDVLEVEFARTRIQEGTYRLGVGDRVRIDVQLHPEISASVTVAPDGAITYHRIGSQPAAGRTLEELRVAVQEALSKQLPDPIVAVFLEQGDVALDRIVDMLMRHPEGTLRQVMIEGDGRVSLPIVGSLAVAGLTPREVEELVNKHLAAELPALRASVRTKLLTRQNFTVMGEVYKPGRYALSGELTLVDALALAGGDTPAADLSSILLIGEPHGNEVVAVLYDLETALDHGNTLPQVRIQPQDTILVLRSGIGDVNLWVDQWIRRNMPFNMTFTYRLDDPNG